MTQYTTPFPMSNSQPDGWRPGGLSGVMVTGRDTVHKWMVDTFIKKPARRRATTWRFTRRSSRC